MVELLLRSHGSLFLDPMEATAAATEVSEDVVLEEVDAPSPVTWSDISSTEVWSGEVGWRRKRAWSGCSSALLGRRSDGVGEAAFEEGATQAAVPGEGEAWKRANLIYNHWGLSHRLATTTILISVKSTITIQHYDTDN